MSEMAKVLIVMGGFLILAGMILLVLGKFPGIGRLPGDILIKKENFTFYFPLATCLLLSLIMSLIMIFFRRR